MKALTQNILYKIIGINGEEYPKHNGNHRTYAKCLKVVSELNRVGEHRPYVIKAVGEER